MVQKTAFGTCPAGTVDAYTITNAAGMSATILTLGATVQKLMVPISGQLQDVCLGYDTAEEYFQHHDFHGTVVGRCANRIAGSRFSLNGQEILLNPSEGPHSHHGGVEGFDIRNWTFCASTDDSVTLCYCSPHGEEGYPGNLRTEVTYRLDAENGLWIRYNAKADADTVVNLTNHTFFSFGADILPFTLQVNAECYTPTDSEHIPTGEIAPVAGTPLDFRSGAVIGAQLSLLGKPIDHNFCIRGQGFRHAATVSGEGVTMEMFTDTPGMQIYCNRFLDPPAGKGGADYSGYCFICLEAQHYPDAVHHANFPTTILPAGETYHQTTLYRFR